MQHVVPTHDAGEPLRRYVSLTPAEPDPRSCLDGLEGVYVHKISQDFRPAGRERTENTNLRCRKRWKSAWPRRLRPRGVGSHRASSALDRPDPCLQCLHAYALLVKEQTPLHLVDQHLQQHSLCVTAPLLALPVFRGGTTILSGSLLSSAPRRSPSLSYTSNTRSSFSSAFSLFPPPLFSPMRLYTDLREKELYVVMQIFFLSATQPLKILSG